MTWRIELSDTATKQIRKLDHQTAKRIVSFLSEKLSTIEDPRSIGEALKGAKLGDYWKYRVGDYRLIADLCDNVATILIVRVGNRREIYRR